MANPKKRALENVPGDFFVDSTCIDCDACRQIAPSVFADVTETSFVHTQPVGKPSCLGTELKSGFRGIEGKSHGGKWHGTKIVRNMTLRKTK